MLVIPAKQSIVQSRNPRIDWSNPINHGLIFCAPLGSLNRDVVGDRVITLASGASLGADYKGESLKASGSAGVASVPIDLSPYTAITVSFWMYWDSFANNDKMAMEYTPNWYLNSGSFAIDPNDSGGKFSVSLKYGASIASLAVDRPSANVWHHYTVAINRNLTKISMYVDGVLRTGTENSFGNNFSNFVNSTLFILSRNNSALYGAGRMQNLCIRSGVSNAAAIAEVEYKNPWQIFQPDRRTVYYDFQGSLRVPFTTAAGATDNIFLDSSNQLRFIKSDGYSDPINALSV